MFVIYQLKYSMDFITVYSFVFMPNGTFVENIPYLGHCYIY